MRRLIRALVPQRLRRSAIDRLPIRIRDAIRGPREDDEVHPERLATLDHIQGSVIEIGCGYRKTIAESIGIDLVPAGELGVVGNVTGRVSQADIAADGGRLPVRTGSFDTLIARHNLEHYVDTLAVLHEWRRIVRPGGRLVIVVPDEEAYEGRTLDLDPTHFHAFSQESLRRLVEVAGMEVLLTRPVVPEWSFLLVAAT